MATTHRISAARLDTRVRIRGFAPVWLNAEYRAADQFGMDHLELAYSKLTVGPKLTFNFTDWIH